MGETRPVVTLTDDKLSGYTIIGNARYPTTGTHLTAIPEGIAPTTPDNNKMTNILGGKLRYGLKIFALPSLILSYGHVLLPYPSAYGLQKMSIMRMTCIVA